MAEPVGELPPSPPAPEPPAPEPPAEPLPGPAAEPVVEPDQVFFLYFRLCGTCFGLFRELVLCRKPSFRSFVFGVSALVLIFFPVFVGFVIWDGFFRATCPLGMLVCHCSIPCFLCFLQCYFLVVII